jgi:tetratricopeptide (TPR) repeat protein
VALVLVAYLPSLRGDYVSDDRILLPHLRQLVAEGGVAALLRRDLFAHESGWTSGLYRPVACFSLLADGRLHGDRAAGCHATNVVLHAVTVLLVLVLALQLGLAAGVAFAAAALFAVHPVNVEAVAWISGRFDLLCAALYVAAIVLYLRARLTRSVPVFGLALAAGTAALFSKEMALTLPAAILLIDRLGLGRGGRPHRGAARGLWAEGWRGAGLRVLPFAGIVAAWGVARTLATRAALVTDDGLPLGEAVFTGGRAALFYATQLLFPWKLHAFAVVPPVTAPWSPWFLGGALLVAAAATLAWRLRERATVATFGILWILVACVPLSNVVGWQPLAGMRFPVAERYLYLPAIGFALALAVVLRGAAGRWPRPRGAFALLVAALVVAGAVRSLARLPAWRSERALLEATVRDDPENAWAHFLLGTALRGAGELERARRELERALALDPRLAAAMVEMGRVHERAAGLDAAIGWYESAVAAEPRSREARLALAVALRQAGRLREAAAQYAALESGGARDSEVLVDRGELALALGQLDAAQRDFEAALAVHPRRREAHLNLGIVALRRGDLDGAGARARAASDIDPGWAPPHQLVGQIAVRRQDFAAASRAFERAVALDSSFVEAQVNLGAAYLNLGDHARAIKVLSPATRREPSPIAWVNLAEAERRSGATAAAEAAYRECLRLDPDLVPARRGLGLLLAATGGAPAEARALLAPLAAADPADAEVVAALARLPRAVR